MTTGSRTRLNGIFIIATAGFATAATANPRLSQECQNMATYRTNAKSETNGEARLAEMKTNFERIRELDAEFRRGNSDLPPAFIKTCRLQTIEIFRLHRDLSPPAIRARAEFWTVQAQLSAHNGDFARSFDEYGEALKITPNDTDTRWEALSVWVKLSLDQLAAADREGRAATQGADLVRRMVQKTGELIEPMLRPTRDAHTKSRQVEALRLYGDMLQKVHMETEAARQWGRLLALEPQDTEAGVRMVTYHLARKDVPAALPLLQRFTNTEAPNPFYVEQLARIYLHDAQGSESAALLGRFIAPGRAKIKVTPALAALYVRSLAESGRTDEAAVFFKGLPADARESAAMGEARAFLNVALARKQLSQGMKAQAIARYSAYLKKFPNDRVVAFESAAILIDGTPEDRRAAVHLVRNFARTPASLTKDQITTSIEAYSAEPAERETLSRLCTHHREEFGELSDRALFPCVDAWVKTQHRKEAEEALKAAADAARGSKNEAKYLKRLMDL
jgi:tetratricopeptide (TPR) repeat protein